MAITSLANLRKAQQRPEERPLVMKTSPTVVAGRPYHTWTSAGLPAAGTAPTTAAVPTRATTGALGQLDPTGTRRIVKMILGWGVAGGMLTISDRLSHQGGLSGTVTTAQTTNLPTSALTRQTSGVGVMLGLDIYTTIGATATTVSASYTNTDPTAGQVTPLTSFGATGFNTAPRRILLPLQVGDIGVTAVASVTVTATTGTAGNFGVTLFYPLCSVPFDMIGRPNAMLSPQHEADFDMLCGGGTWFPIIETGACIEFMVHSTTTTVAQIQGTLFLAED